jgi:hypothetical protein
MTPKIDPRSHRRFGLPIALGFWILVLGIVLTCGAAWASEPSSGVQIDFPPSLESYDDSNLESIPEILAHRAKTVPFNLVATLIFLCAIVHTFIASKFSRISHQRREAHKKKIDAGEARPGSADILAGFLHFLGEVEVVFGLWLIPLVAAIAFFYDWPSVVGYFEHGVNLTEPAFVVVIMVLASTRPVLKMTESIMLKLSSLLGGSLSAFWFTTLTIGPLLGSFITEPAAMTITALLLSQKFYELGPSTKFKYATLGLLFVNVSVGGTLTNFAAPPILMVAGPWDWGTAFMMSHFGWKVIIGILISNGLYFWLFRDELSRLQQAFALRSLSDDISRRFVTREMIDREWREVSPEVEKDQKLIESTYEATETWAGELHQKMASDILPELKSEGVDPDLIDQALEKRFDEVLLYHVRRLMPGLLPEYKRPSFQDPDWDMREDSVPLWVTVIHLLFMGWTIVNAHHPALFVLGLLFFLGFAQVTPQYQNRIHLQPAMLVGFFLAGLVSHGGVQAWWIAPVLGSLSELPLMLGATMLTAFNDNSAITYLSTLVPGFTDSLKYAVVAGAVAGGGLTVIANAPNPAGQSILKKHFDVSVSPKNLLLAALIPTTITWICLAVL